MNKTINVNLGNFIKHINFVNSLISDDFNLSILNNIYAFINTLNIDVNKDFNSSFKANGIEIIIDLKHSLEEDFIVFSDFYYSVSIDIKNSLSIYSLDVQTMGVDYAEFDLIEFRKFSYNVYNIIKVPHLNNKRITDKQLNQEIINILNINTNESFYPVGDEYYPFITLMREPINLTAKYSDGKIYLAEQTLLYNDLQFVKDSFIVV